jgi:peptidoglycan/xylan/chitin deacetylase (PgdA/CDA1 family)
MHYTLVNLGQFENKKIVCLTLDVEHDFGTLLTNPTFDGLRNIPLLVDVLKEKNIPLTCYVQGSLFERYGQDIRYLSNLEVEYQPHSYSHPRPQTMDFEWEIKKSKEAYLEFFGKEPIGYRSPDGYINGDQYYETLVLNGFKYDSSVFPSFRPGRFNHLHHPVNPYYECDKQITEFPFSVLSQNVRIPISLSYMKLFGITFLKLLEVCSFPNLVIFDFHLHDLSYLSSFDEISIQNRLPAYQKALFKRIYLTKGDQGFAILNRFIETLQKKGYEFLKVEDVFRSIVP